MTLVASSGRGVGVCADAAGRCPVQLSEVGGQRSSVAGIDRVAEESASVGHDGQWSTLGVGPPLLEHPEHHRVEGSGLDVLAEPETHQTLAHLAGGLAREREGQCVSGSGRLGGDAVGDPTSEHPGLAGAGAGDHGDEL